MRLDYDIKNGPLNTMTNYINRQWRDSSTLSHSSSFHRAASGKSWASLGHAAFSLCTIAVVIWEMTTTFWREWLLTPACVDTCRVPRERECAERRGPRSSRLSGGHAAFIGSDPWDKRAQVPFQCCTKGKWETRVTQRRVQMNAEKNKCHSTKREKLFLRSG